MSALPRPSMLSERQLVEERPTIDPFNGTPIHYEYVDLPPAQPKIIKKIVEKKVGRKEVVEDVIIEIEDRQYKDVIRTIPRSKETAVARPTRKIHERTVQEVRRVPRIVEREVKKRVEVKGEPQEIKVVKEVVTYNPINTYYNKEQAVILSQTFKPSVNITDKIVEVPVARLTPKINYVDVHVAVPIKRTTDFRVIRDDHFHKPARIADTQFNSLLIAMNDHLTEEQMQDLPFKRSGDGSVKVHSEQLNAILLNDQEQLQLGITVRAAREIFPRGGEPTAPQPFYSHSNSHQLPAKLIAGLSTLSDLPDNQSVQSYVNSTKRSSIRHTKGPIPRAPITRSGDGVGTF